MKNTTGFHNIVKVLFSISLLVAIAATPAKAGDQSLQMQLPVDGQLLTLLLEPSRVTHSLNVVNSKGAPQSVPVRTYIGKIKGDNNSWVRMTRSINKIDGVISRYGKRFRFQQSANRPFKIQSLAHNHDARVTLTKNTSNPFTTIKPPVTRVARIGIVVDSKFNALHHGRGLEYALGIINSVDGIFREEFGLALQVETAINITDRRNDPLSFGNVAIEKMLRGFRNYRMKTPLIGNDISMVHLFSGNTPNDAPVGLAWIDTACRTDGYDVGISTHYTHDILLAAHELAHNLGAQHDSDTACAASTDKVMWPYISGATTQQFSSCTVASVQQSMAGSCHAMVVNQELAMTTPATNALNNNPLQEYPAAMLAAELPDHNHNAAIKFR